MPPEDLDNDIAATIFVTVHCIGCAAEGSKTCTIRQDDNASVLERMDYPSGWATINVSVNQIVAPQELIDAFGDEAEEYLLPTFEYGALLCPACVRRPTLEHLTRYWAKMNARLEEQAASIRPKLIETGPADLATDPKVDRIRPVLRVIRKPPPSDPSAR